MKRKDREMGICPICKQPSPLRVQLGKNPKKKCFTCVKCRKYLCF